MVGSPEREPDPSADLNAILSSDKYVEPTLESTRVSNSVMLAARLLAFVWAVAVAVAAVITRSRASDGGDDGSLVTGIGRLGIAAAVLFLGIGWLWSDRRVRNIRLLDGRRPTRARCALGWLAPGIWVALMAVTIVQFEPNELFDFRPAIIVTCFMLAAWRPYALVRRILTMLTRISSDALIGIAFVLDVAGFGLLWWQLTTWPTTIDAGAGSADTTIGVAVAAAIAFGANLIVWRMLIADTDAAETYRLTQLSTRHDHKVLRLRGIDPNDPKVWWELVQRHLERQPAAPAPARDTASFPPSRPLEHTVRVGDLLAQVRADNSLALRRLGGEGTTAVMDQVRSRLSSDLNVSSDTSTTTTVDDRDLRDRFADALGTSRFSEDRSVRIPQISLKRRLGLEDGGGPGGADDTLQRLFISAGRAEVDAALAQRAGGADGGQAPRTEPPRLYQLEAARFLLLGGFIAIVVAAVWLLSHTIDPTIVVDGGRLPVDVVDSVDLARRTLVTALTVALAVVPLWAASVASHTRRVGAIDTGARLSLAAFAGVGAIAGLSFVLDGDTRGTTSLLLLVPATVLSIWGALTATRTQLWFHLSSRSLVGWAIGMPTLLVITWVGGMQRPIEPSDSLPTLTFFAVLAAVLASVLVVVLATTAAEIEDSIRVSPELAVPVA